jgi:ubiquinone biosynthesis protein COQ4
LNENNITLDSRTPPISIPDPELSYIMSRYRQIHDLLHVISGFESVTLQSELAVKWFEYTAFGLPASFLSSIVGPLRLGEAERGKFFDDAVPWAVKAARGVQGGELMCVEFESMWEWSVEDVRRAVGVEAYQGQRI